jgi:hypothetical protein
MRYCTGKANRIANKKDYDYGGAVLTKLGKIVNLLQLNGKSMGCGQRRYFAAV